jgi:hypothetical protein
MYEYVYVYARPTSQFSWVHPSVSAEMAVDTKKGPKRSAGPYVCSGCRELLVYQ